MSHSDLQLESYQILSKLGEGGSSEVYLAIQKTLDRNVVLKVLKTNNVNNRAVVRFQNEARALSKLNHPNIASVYDFGCSNNGHLYLTIEFVDGVDLATLIQQNNFIEIDDALEIVIQLCHALDHAHKLGIIHRDIKPANIIITESVETDTKPETSRMLRAKLLDFGISKLTENATESGAATQGTHLLGSPLFMSPEQCEGKPISKFSDHYSLGCVFYNMLSGKAPFVGETALLTMMMHQNEQPQPLSKVSPQDVPEAIEKIVDQLMSKNPDQRYDSLLQVAEELQHLRFSPFDSETPTVTDTPPMSHSSKQNKLLVLVGTLFVFVSCIALLLAFYLMDDKPTSKNNPILPKDDFMPKMPLASESFHRKMLSQKDFEFTDKLAGDEDMPKVARNPKIQIVNLPKTGVSSEALRSLKSLKLISLDISYCKDLGSLDFLEDLPWLQVLNLHDTDIGDKDLAYVVGLKNLRILRIDGCELSDKGLKQLSKSDSLLQVLLPLSVNQKTIDQLHEELPQCVVLPHYHKSKIEMLTAQLNISDPYKLAIQLNKTPRLKQTSACYLKNLTVICQFLLSSGNLNEAEKNIALLTKLSEKSGNQHAIAVAYLTSADYEAGIGNHAKALQLCEKSLPLFRATLIANDPELISTCRTLTTVLMKIGEKERAVKVATEGIKLFEHYHEGDAQKTDGKKLRPEQLQCIDLRELAGLHYLYDKHDKPTGALLFAKNIELLKWLKQTSSVLFARNLIQLAHCQTDSNKRKQNYLDGMAIIKASNFAAEEPNTVITYCDASFSLVQLYDEQSDPENAISELRRTISTLQKARPLDKTRDEAYRRLLVAYLSKAGRTEEANAANKELEKRYHKKAG